VPKAARSEGLFPSFRYRRRQHRVRARPRGRPAANVSLRLGRSSSPSASWRGLRGCRALRRDGLRGGHAPRRRPPESVLRHGASTLVGSAGTMTTLRPSISVSRPMTHAEHATASRALPSRVCADAWPPSAWRSALPCRASSRPGRPDRPGHGHMPRRPDSSASCPRGQRPGSPGGILCEILATY